MSRLRPQKKAPSGVVAEGFFRMVLEEEPAILEFDAGVPRLQADAIAVLAERFYDHHWSCPECLAGTRLGDLRHDPCPEGRLLWDVYAGAAGRLRLSASGGPRRGRPRPPR